MKRTLLLGELTRMEQLAHWFDVSEELFDVCMAYSETGLHSHVYMCEIKPIKDMAEIAPVYDVIFVCSELSDQIKGILLNLGISEAIIKSQHQICEYLSKRQRMGYYAEYLESKYYSKFPENVSIGAFTYGEPSVLDYGEGSSLCIGKFCSIAHNVTFMLGGKHRMDWCTTYPFNGIMEEYSWIVGHPSSDEDIVVGNDVWIASDVKILSGVHIGDGAVIASGAVVAKDVEPYAMVGGVPAVTKKKRFEDRTIERLLEMQWWDWEWEHIYDAIPLLLSEKMELLMHYYDTVVLDGRSG